jgi:hypothetical protein
MTARPFRDCFAALATMEELLVARFYMALSGHTERMKMGETQQGSRGRSPCGGSARGHPSLKPFLFRAEQRESDAQPYASLSWEPSLAARRSYPG